MEEFYPQKAQIKDGINQVPTQPAEVGRVVRTSLKRRKSQNQWKGLIKETSIKRFYFITTVILSIFAKES